jgi:hypothetical protein
MRWWEGRRQLSGLFGDLTRDWTGDVALATIMRVATGKVVAGKVVMDGAPFEDGAKVTVIAADDAETFELGPEDEAALLAAIGEADRGEIIDSVELLAKLGSRD